MKRALLAISLPAIALWAAAVEKPIVTRAALGAMEASFDKRIRNLGTQEPFDLLGATRGVYLEGYGAVFTAEVNLIVVPSITPFRPQISKQEIARIHERKLAQVPKLKDAMREMLISSAASLDTVPSREQVVVGVNLFHFSWEDMSGLPSQVLMQAQRQALLDYKTGRIKDQDLQSAIRVQEF